MEQRVSKAKTVFDVIRAMSDNNPGAITVVVKLLEQSPHIDPDNIMGSYGPIILLDQLGIYGPDIWILYKDVCNYHVPTMVGLLRAVQLGEMTSTRLREMIQSRPNDIEIRNALDAVCKALPNFQINYVK